MPNELINAVISRNFSAVQECLSRGGDIHETDEKGFSAIHYCFKNDYTQDRFYYDRKKFSDEILRALLDAGANINQPIKTQNNSTLLMQLAQHPNDGLAKVLANGGDVNLRDSGGNTAMHYACGILHLYQVQII